MKEMWTTGEVYGLNLLAGNVQETYSEEAVLRPLPDGRILVRCCSFYNE